MAQALTVVDNNSAPDEGGYLDYGKLRKQYLDWASVKRGEIDEQREARRYYHGDQYTDSERKIFKKRKQPAITFNRTARKIDGIVGLLERLRQDPKAFPRTPQHEEGAEIASMSIRYAMDNANWSAISAEAERVAAVDGIGGVELGLEPGSMGDQEITLDSVDIDTFFYDPRSFRHDFSDARFKGVAKWMDLESAKVLFPDHAEELDGLIDGGSDTESNAQQDRERKWIDSEQKRVFVVEHWYLHLRDGKEVWCFSFWVKGLILAEGESPFYDDKDKTICRFRMFSANVDHQGDRYGFIRNMKSAQDEINHRRSKMLHMIHSRRIIARKGSLDDPEKTRREAARNDGLIEWNTEKPEFEDTKSMIDFKAQAELYQDSKAEIDGYGPNPQLVGETRGEQSGRAIALLQQAGIAELGPYIRAVKQWKLDVYRHTWCAMRRYWTAERWIRVTDEEGAAQFIKVNELVTGDSGPQMQNALGQLDVDIILDEGPDNINAMQDAFEIIVQGLAQNGVPVPPSVMIKLSQLPGSVKKEILDEFEKQSQKPDPKQAEAQAQLQLEQQKAQIDAQQSQQKAMIEAQQAQDKAAIEANIARQKAQDEIEVKRMVALADIQLERERAAAQLEIDEMKARASIAVQAKVAESKAEQATQ